MQLILTEGGEGGESILCGSYRLTYGEQLPLVLFTARIYVMRSCALFFLYSVRTYKSCWFTTHSSIKH